jgi:hypothetical protein
MSRTKALIRLVCFSVVGTALVLATAGVAFGATGDPILGLAGLQAKLDARGPVPGYFKTVVRGSEIVTIPIEVLALTGDTPGSSLIMFEASGPLIDHYGGIVSGMSGSPLYVQDEGMDKVIGALSYGDIFTLGGAGLATPIEPMIQLATDYSPRVEMLSSPVEMSGRMIDRVIISADPDALKNVSPRSAFVARSLSSVFIGGMPPASRAYKKLAKDLGARGLSVVAIAAPLASGASTFTTDLVPGSALGVLATRGDIWIGGLGTTTWVDGDTLVAFGHPAFYTGPASLYMCNAWVAGVWPSSYEPYKIGYPSVVRGTITQDRGAGIMGRLGAPPAETPITARVANGGREATAAAWVSSEMLDTGQVGYLANSVAYAAGAGLFDLPGTPGSADTTATVRLSVGGVESTVTLVDVMDSDLDIFSEIGYDADLAVNSIVGVLADGVEQPRILSIDVEASMTTHRRQATIAGVSLVEPLHEGDNRVNVSMLVNGIADTQTIETTLTVPEGAPLTGILSVQGTHSSRGSDGFEIIEVASRLSGAATRKTVAQIVDELNTALPDNSFTITLTPGDPVGDFDFVAVSETTPWVVDGNALATITELSADVSPYVVSYGGAAIVSGEVFGPSAPTTVSVYGIPEGSDTPILLARERALIEEGTLAYMATLDGLTRNTLIIVSVEGGADYTPATAESYVEVRAKILLTSSRYDVRFGRLVTLTARVLPKNSRGRVTFQYWESTHKRWRTIGFRYLHAAGSYAHAQIKWMPRWGARRVRAIYGGNFYNAGVTSRMITTRAH